MTKRCSVCSSENTAEARYCSACGAAFREESIAYDAFISYRRDGGSHVATAIKVMLEAQFRKRVFLDVRELQVGRFDESLLFQIESAPSFIIILSCGSLDRCVEKSDWLKREVIHALDKNRNIIPVMLDDFIFPVEAQLALLPEVMRVLPHLQTISYSHIHQESSVRRIAEAMRLPGKSSAAATVSLENSPVPMSPIAPALTLNPEPKTRLFNKKPEQIVTPPVYLIKFNNKNEIKYLDVDFNDFVRGDILTGDNKFCVYREESYGIYSKLTLYLSEINEIKFNKFYTDKSFDSQVMRKKAIISVKDKEGKVSNYIMEKDSVKIKRDGDKKYSWINIDNLESIELIR